MARILVIDDSESALALVSQWLTEAGHEAVPVSSGRRALALLDAEKFDVVITDIFMPQPDGLEILSEARASFVQAPFIAMSSKSDEFNFFKVAKAYGAVSTLQKPFDAGKLQAAVAAALAGRTGRALKTIATAAAADAAQQQPAAAGAALPPQAGKPRS